MPGYFYRPMSRKQFLNSTAKTCSAIGLAALSDAVKAQSADERAEASHVHLALLSDTHIPADAANEYRGFHPVENLQQVLPQVLATAPDAVIINGDAARLTGEIADYQALRKLLSPVAEQLPIHIGMGNHDHRENFFRIFPQQDSAGPLQGKHVTVWERHDLRFVVLDSLLYVDKVAGLLGKEQRAWLSEFLSTGGSRPTVFFVHHTLGDGDGELLDADRFFELVIPHRHVKAVFYGHSHVYSYNMREHIHLINLPAVGYNFSDDQPVGWVDAHFSGTGAELTLHAVGGNLADHGKTTRLTWHS